MRTLLMLTLICIIAVSSLLAAVPNTMNYQGRLTDAAGDPVADGPYLVKFIIYDAPIAGTDIWNTGFQNVTTTNGLFSYQLGSMVSLPAGIFSDTSRYLGITVGTDPELSPRSRFITSAYAFKAESADLALDADSLGGSEPSFYLDWNNMTNVPADIADGDDVDTDWNNLVNIPAGFADGTDDEGLSQATADADYVNVTGDNMTGALNAEDGSGVVTAEVSGANGGFKTFGSDGLIRSQLYSFTWGQLLLLDNNEKNTVQLNANDVNGGSLLLIDPSGSNDITLTAGGAGNSTVQLPNNAIDNTEILDEPGITQAFNNTNTTIPYSGTSMTTIVQTSITIPSSGYIFVTSKCYVRHEGTTSSNIIHLQIDDAAGGGTEAPYFNIVGNAAYSSTSVHRFSTSLIRTFFKSNAGTYTFYLEGEKFGSLGSSIVRYPVITAIFIPTSYGSVSTVASDPNGDPDAQQITITDEDGNNHQAYKVDLRNLELKAKEAQFKAKEAELELLKARQQQNRDIQ